MKKLISLILCAALLLCMAACTPAPAQTPTTDPAKDIYTTASDALNSLSDVTLELQIDTLTMVADDELSEKSVQTLTYQAKDTDEAMIAMDEAIDFGLHLLEDAQEEEEDEAEPISYSEIWYKDTVYATESEDYRYRGTVDAAAAAARYTPVVLLDATLYSSITSEESETGTRIRFAQPTAPEGWAVPEEAQLVEASGNAFVNTEGKLTEMYYEITYTYGSVQVKKTVASKPLETPKTVTAPETPEDYIAISHVDALRAVVATISNLTQTDTVAVRNAETVTSDAAAVVKSQNTQATMHGRKKNTIAKFDTSIYYANYASGETEEYKLEETFQNGKLTSVVNDGLPSTDSSITWEDVRLYAAELMFAGMLDTDYWEDVTATDLGTLYYLEFQLNENFGNTMQNGICNTLWNDPSFLLNYASDYKNTDLNGYLSIDKYTGLPVATGYYYKGVHTIEKQDYALSMQFDQSIESPALGAYKDITEKLPEEKEPETKATPLFYRVTGQDGQQMWLFGTIHVGDERTAYLPQEIRDAFEASDALAVECDTEAFDKQLETDEKLAETVSGLSIYTDGKEHIKNALSEEDHTLALKLLKAVGGNNLNMPYAKPYLWSNTIETFYLRQGYQLHDDQGVEARLMAWAEELDKEILEIESSLEQLQMLTGFSEELQIWMLEDLLSYTGQEYWEESMTLYELWCAGNEAELRKELCSQWDDMELTEEELTKYKPLMEEYDKAMSFDRNEGMRKAAVEYLESGKVIFYAVGLAHLLDDTNGLVNALQEAGYAVEQVSFEG